MTMPASSSRLQVPKPSTHPRRPPANASVSLRHPMASARANKGGASTSSGRRSSSDDNDSPSSVKPRVGRDSSGESSNAEQWFNKTNNDVREGEGSYRDNEPPYFLRNESSLETPPEGYQQTSNEGQISDSLPLRTELLQLGADGNSVDEYRGVIDDLTVQNRKLKRRLKKYEKLHDAHLKDDKLFELRIHGLPSEKKRELEDMLRKFASSLGTNGDNAFPTDGYNSLLPMLNKEMSNATYQSDSAYASMSRSGPGSSAVSASDQKAKNTPRGHTPARNRNIHSYLHDIPVGLLPQEAPMNMTERAKKKLVVRKMEQLFVGKGAVGGHQQPLQQQEVSQSAAQADRSARVQAGQTAQMYGAREAQMLTRKLSDEDRPGVPDHVKGPPQQESNLNGAGKQATTPSDMEQRPTQPIDLDPDRAQVPQENIKYMRAMGFSPPHPGNAAQDGHGWIYINFLFNMAQLHTLHVTPDFARDAMSEISKRLEVSTDGRKVRWCGGESVTPTGSGDGTPETGNSNELLDGQSPRKRIKLANGNSSSRSTQAMDPPSRRVPASSRHTYTPMFHHRSSSDGSDDSSSEDEDTEESDQRWNTLGGSSAMTSSGVQASTSFNFTGQRRKKPRRDEGPIIFYNNVRFCTDLSGERRSMTNQNVPMYTTYTEHPIGGRRDVDNDAEGRRPLAETGALPEAMDLDDNPSEDSQLLIVHDSPAVPSSEQVEPKPIDLEVTGIGGVWPEDNFMLNVEIRHAQVADSSVPTVSKTLPPRFASILARSEARNQNRARMGYEVTDVDVKKLQPAQLPPALGFMDGDDDESSYYDSSDSDTTSPDTHALSALHPEVGIQPVGFAHHYDSSDYDSDEDEDSDDGEVDLLAGIRAAHPEFVRAQEREYDANMAERLAEEIPAGSSAATAGGGSGYASPVSGVAREDVRQARAALRARGPRTPKMGREGTGSSMVVHGLEGSEDGDGDDANDDDGTSDLRS